MEIIQAMKIHKLRHLNRFIKRWKHTVGSMRPDQIMEPLDRVSTSDRCSPGACVQQPRVIIIGAGMAGLSAAHTLAQGGITNFKVLEAKERPGGRIMSCWLGDCLAELGPPWDEADVASESCLHGLARLNELAQPAGVTSRGLLHQPLGEHYKSVVAARAYAIFKHIESEVRFLRKYETASVLDGPYFDFVAMRIHQEVRKVPEKDQCDTARILHGLTNVIHNKYYGDITMITYDEHGNYANVPGGKLRVPLGTTAMLAPLLRNIPNDTIEYCKPVQTILWGTAQKAGMRAVVKCFDGEEFPADYVIVTVSIGVLRRHASLLFCPTLPASKINAICNINWGMCNKIFFRFPTPFYRWQKKDLRYRSDVESMRKLNNWTRGIVAIDPVRNSDYAVCVRVIGQDSVNMERLSDKRLIDNFYKFVRNVLKDEDMPQPVCVTRSRWATDAYFGGAYALPCYGCPCPCDCTRDLAEPLPSCSVPPILFFAGEATASEPFIGTLKGARMSGIREAERVAHLTELLQGPPLPDCVEVPVEVCEAEENENEKDKKKSCIKS